MIGATDEIEELLKASLAYIQEDYLGDEAWAHADAQLDYISDGLAHAARDLVRVVDSLPSSYQPVGWNK